MSSRILIEKVSPTGSGYRVKVSVREEPLVVSAELYYRHQLKEGIVITRAQLEQLTVEAELEACERGVSRLLALREHSCGEMRMKLARKNHRREVIDRVIKKYLQKGLLDDARFSANLARRTLQRKPSGKAYLVAVLQRKHVQRALAEQVVDSLLATEDETALATAALERKWPQLVEFDVETARRKAYNYLSRRGIGYAAAKEAFATLAARTKEVTED